jgi:hypothetical protein
LARFLEARFLKTILRERTPHNKSLPAKFIRPPSLLHVLLHGLLYVLLYGLVNAVLYSAVLPLWEGFDEEFHYGYVQYLVAHHRFPILGHTGLSQEINQSIGLLPMSYVMIENLHLKGVRTFDQYFALPDPVRRQLFEAAQRIPPGAASQESDAYYMNYEVHQAPLAYLALAIPERFLSRVPLPRRVLLLRLLAAIACVALMYGGMLALAREIELRAAFAAVLIFLIFSCQMFWATIAHIGNDWLAVPLAVWLIVWTIRADRRPSLRSSVGLAIVLSLGLLSKAYFLVFVPLYLIALAVWYRKGSLRAPGLAVGLGLPLLLAGPWYLRNLSVYGNLSGRLEESSGGSLGSAMGSLASIPWLKSIPFMARGAFWMGNSSFTDFSIRTMDTVLVLLGIALLLYCRTVIYWRPRIHCPPLRRRRWTEAMLWAPVLAFLAAMIYVAGSSFSYTHGVATAASPWYLQAVMVPLLCLAMLGCQRSRDLGRWAAAAMVVLWGYVLAATYVAKLFPMYGGFPGGRSTLRDIVHWYLTDWPRTAELLSTTALLPARWLTTLLAIFFAALLTALYLLLAALRDDARDST